MSSTIFEVKVSLAPSVSANDCELEEITLGKVLLSERWRGQIEALRTEADAEKRKALKKKLPCFTPGGTFSHISEKGLTTPTGYLCADLDYKPEQGLNAELEEFNLKAAVARLPYVAYCGKSCGGKGYFLIIKIADASKYKAYYKALQADFEKGGLILDKACSNIAFKRFVSWDENPYINTAALPYSYTLPERAHTALPKMEHITPEKKLWAFNSPELSKDETRERVEAVIRYCEQNRIDITDNYNDWSRILAALANTFGVGGEEYAQRISSLYPDYSRNVTSEKYKSYLSTQGSRGAQANIGTFFYIARTNIGSDFSSIRF